MREFLRIYSKANNVSGLITQKLKNIFYSNSELVFLCIGTDKVIFDSFGCMVGQLLKNNNLPFYVYGNMTNCITGKNVNFAVDYIRTMHPNALLIVIDAMATSSQCHLEEFVICDEYISTLSNNIKIEADLFLYGITTLIINKKITNTRLYNIYRMAKTLAQIILEATKK